MSGISLYGEAHQYLQELNLPENESKQVKCCIISYTHRTGFFACLQYVAFRVWNAIKSLFGYSAWQKSIALVQEALSNKGKAILSKFTLREQNKFIITKHITRTANLLAGQLLNYCLLSNDLRIDHESNKRENFVQRFENTILELCTTWQKV